MLKPGGLIACREMICESSFVHPDMGIMKTGWNALEDLLTFDDGHPQMGKEMKTHILEAGVHEHSGIGFFRDPQLAVRCGPYPFPSQAMVLAAGSAGSGQRIRPARHEQEYVGHTKHRH